ncbi:YhgE/Pip family protein [Lentilactobacillus laojiaonis]|uniref:YhgE/Pip family protein n=1 Tax=Lentilactobacillus laojiaonis TaxID=2883998 RepID=UPI001D0B4E25|nr:YhgE/Pip family protein [Lentilactobacillus laojiaonis]UDM32354.1 YhgE/Pip family protein [Lentilactobacillus laojiaonis]
MNKKNVKWLAIGAAIIAPIGAAVLFVHSIWDPFGRTSQLPVAVVNQDQPVNYQGKQMAVGKNLVSQLKNNKQLNWKFVSPEQAKDGMSKNKYYTVITIPKNFSQNATTATAKTPKQMQLSYKTNDSYNYIGRIISDTAASQLNSQVKSAVTKAYALATFESVKTAGAGFQRAAGGATQLKDGSVTLSDGLHTYTSGVSKVDDGLITLKSSVSALPSGVSKLATGSKTLSNGLNTLNGSTGTLASGVSKLATGSKKETAGLNTLSASIPALSSGVIKLNNGGLQLNNGLKTLNKSTPALASGVSKLTTGSKKETAGLKTLNKSTPELANGVSKLYSGSKELHTGLNTLNKSTPTLSSGVKQLNDGGKTLNSSMVTYVNGVYQVNDGIDTLYNSMVDSGLVSIDSDGNATSNLNADQLNKLKDIDTSGLKNLSSDDLATLSKLFTELSSAGITSDDLKALTSIDLTSLNSGLSKLSSLNMALFSLKSELGLIKNDLNITTKSNDKDNASDNSNSTDTIKANLAKANENIKNSQTATNTNSSQDNSAIQSKIAEIKTDEAKIADSTATQSKTKEQVSATADKLNLTSAQKSAMLAAVDSASNNNDVKTAQDKLTADINDLSNQTKSVNSTSQRTGNSTVDQAESEIKSAESELDTLSNDTSTDKQSGSLSDEQLKKIQGHIKTSEDVISFVQKEMDSSGLTDASNLSKLSKALNTLTKLQSVLKDSDPNGTLVNTISTMEPTLVSLLANKDALVSVMDSFKNNNIDLSGLNKNVPSLPQLHNGAQQLADNGSAVLDGTNQLSTGLTQLNSQVPTLVSGVKKLDTGSGSLESGLSTLNGKVPTLTNGVMSLLNGSTQISNGLTTLNGKVPTLTSGVSKLATGSNQLSNGLGSLKSQVPTLSSGVNKLTTGSTQISNGLTTLNGKVPTLTNGVSKLANGGNQLTTGLSTLNSSTPALMDGVNQLVDGGNQLTTNNAKLLNGVGKISNGNKTLATSLQAGADQVNAQPLSDKTAQMFADPSALTHSSISTNKNFGTAMIPFIVSLITFIGVTALVAAFAYLRSLNDRKQLLKLLGLVIAQSAALGLVFGLITQANHVVGFMAVTMLLATFVMALETALWLYLGKIAFGIASVLIFVQLCVSNNIFPSQTVKTAYAGIAKFMPITYSNAGLSAAIGSGISGLTIAHGIEAALILTIALIALVIIKTKPKSKSGYVNIPDEELDM